MSAPRDDIARMVERVTRQLADDGHLIEAGWKSFRIRAISAAAPPIQCDEMRTAFFAGAQHLYASVMTALDAGEEATGADLRRMELIHDELTTFTAALAARLGPAGGRAP